MTSPFNWRDNPRPVPPEFRPRNDAKGIMPPIVLPNSSKFNLPPMQKKGKV
jgi:hypothetical protein